MSKYEVGNKVLLRKDLEVGKIYKWCSLTKSMKQYLGKEAIIEEKPEVPKKEENKVSDDAFFDDFFSDD